MQFIDLSLPLENDRAWAPWWARNRVKYQDHEFGRRIIRFLLGIKKKHLATGTGWANEQNVTLIQLNIIVFFF